jgi:hypothetical protein
MYSRDFTPKTILKDVGPYASPHWGRTYIRADALCVRHCLLLASTEPFQERCAVARSRYRGDPFPAAGRTTRKPPLPKLPSDHRQAFTSGYDLLEAVVGTADGLTMSTVEVSVRELMSQTESPSERYSAFLCWFAVVVQMVGGGGLMDTSRDVARYYSESLLAAVSCSCIGDEASEGIARVLIARERCRLDWLWLDCVARVEQWAVRNVSNLWDPAQPCDRHEDIVLSFHRRKLRSLEEFGFLKCLRCGDRECKSQSCFNDGSARGSLATKMIM